MQFIDPFPERPSPRSKLGSTLLRLHRHLEVNRQREQDALELFQAWQARWSDHRELIARHLECLDRELSQLAFSAVPAPHLSLLALSAESEESASDTDNAVRAGQTDAHSEDDEDDGGIISSSNVHWHEA